MSDANLSEEPTTPGPGTSPGRRLARNLALYTLARLALVAILTVVIVFGARLVSVDIPLVVAILFGIVIAMPLSLTLFKGLRGQVNSDIAAVDERRRRDKAQLRARLRGEPGGSESGEADAPAETDSSEPGSGGAKTEPGGESPKDSGGTGGTA